MASGRRTIPEGACPLSHAEHIASHLTHVFAPAVQSAGRIDHERAHPASHRPILVSFSGAEHLRKDGHRQHVHAVDAAHGRDGNGSRAPTVEEAPRWRHDVEATHDTFVPRQVPGHDGKERRPEPARVLLAAPPQDEHRRARQRHEQPIDRHHPIEEHAVGPVRPHREHELEPIALVRKVEVLPRAPGSVG